jgi:GTP-binding nuclear protein Ran
MNCFNNIPHFKVVLVGDSSVGKSTYTRRLISGDFDNKIVSTIGVEAHPIKINTNKGEYCLCIWDVDGNPNYKGLIQGNYINTDAVIYMFDTTNKTSITNIDKWIDESNNACNKKFKSILVGNKVDKLLNKNKNKQYVDIQKDKMDIPYYEISVKDNYNLYQPLLKLLELLTNNKNLTLVTTNN